MQSEKEMKMLIKVDSIIHLSEKMREPLDRYIAIDGGEGFRLVLNETSKTENKTLTNAAIQECKDAITEALTKLRISLVQVIQKDLDAFIDSVTP